MKFKQAKINPITHSQLLREFLQKLASAIASTLTSQVVTNISAGSILAGVLGIAIAPTLALAQTSDPNTLGIPRLTCAEDNQLALNQCAAQWQRTTDFLRSLVYEDLYWQLSPAAQAQLATAEAAWYDLQESHCRQASEPYRDGSIYPLLYFSCKATLTNARIADLQAWGIPQFTLDEADQRLTTLLQTLERAHTYNPRQWEHYEALHCQMETLRFPDQPTQADQCHHRLVESRIRQLETTIGP